MRADQNDVSDEPTLSPPLFAPFFAPISGRVYRARTGRSLVSANLNAVAPEFAPCRSWRHYLPIRSHYGHKPRKLYELYDAIMTSLVEDALNNASERYGGRYAKSIAQIFQRVVEQLHTDRTWAAPSVLHSVRMINPADESSIKLPHLNCCE